MSEYFILWKHWKIQNVYDWRQENGVLYCDVSLEPSKYPVTKRIPGVKRGQAEVLLVPHTLTHLKTTYNYEGIYFWGKLTIAIWDTLSQKNGAFLAM